jgi:hypothetical protein
MRHIIPKSWFLLLVCAPLVGCGVPGVPKPPSLELPQQVDDLRAVRKGNHVYLAWTVPSETTDHLAVRHPGTTRICRSVGEAPSDCANPLDEVPASQQAGSLQTMSGKASNKAQESYTDQLPPALVTEDPGAPIFYVVSVLNEHGKSAGISNVVNVPSLAVLQPPSSFSAQITVEGVVLNWARVSSPPEKQGLRYAYRVYRRTEGSTSDTVAGEVALDSGVQIVDHSFEWEKKYSYRVTVVTRLQEDGKPEIQFESDDTPPVLVFAHDVFPPAAPAGLQAVFSGPGQPPFIDLIWASDTDADLAGYNVFRHQPSSAPVKINSNLVATPAFRDTNVASGNTYAYSVSAVDVRGNESARSQEAAEAVP